MKFLVEFEAAPFLMRSARRRRVWDIVYLGQFDSDLFELADIVGRRNVVAPGGVAVIEHRSDAPLPAAFGSLRQWKILEKDGNSLSFYNRQN